MRKKVGLLFLLVVLIILGTAQAYATDVDIIYNGERIDGFGGLKDIPSKYFTPDHTIKINKSFDVGKSDIKISNVTFDLGGNTLTIKKPIVFEKVTIKDGTIKADASVTLKNTRLSGASITPLDKLDANVLVYEGDSLVYASDGIASVADYFKTQYTIKLNKQDFTIGASNLTISNATLDLNGNNVTVNPGSGPLTFEGATIINSANTIPTITVSSGKTLDLKSTQLKYTPGLYQINNNGTLNLTGSTVNPDDNVNVSNPIISSTNGSTLNFNNSTVQNIIAGGSTPIIASTNGSTLNFNNSTVQNIKAGGSTPISADRATITITGGSFENNSGYLGGVMRCMNNSTLNINNASFTGNTATHGGALRIEETTTTIENAAFGNNKSSPGGSGGALDIRGSSVSVKESSFTGNGETNHGGAIAAYKNIELNLTNVTFTGNTTSKSSGEGKGGAVYARGGKLNILGCSFEKNVAQGDQDYKGGQGGAVYADADVQNGAITGVMNLDIDKGTEFRDNQANLFGGAVCVGGDYYTFNLQYGEGIRATIGTAKFIGNQVVRADNEIGGGALYVHNDAEVQMEDVAITGNSTIGAGGGIGTCPNGRGRVELKHGAAIFDNTAAGIVSQYGGSDYQDIFLLNGKQEHKVVEAMFNGGVHNWIKKEIRTELNLSGQIETYDGFIAGSAPSNKDITKAKVLFEKNSVMNTTVPNQPWYIGCGGAIGNNGLVVIGEGGDTVGLKITKQWDDHDNINKVRPDIREFFRSIQIINDMTDMEHLEINFKDKDLKKLDSSDRRYNGLKEKFETEDLYWCVLEDEEKDPIVVFGAVKKNGEYLLIINGLPVEWNEQKLEYAVHEIDKRGYVHVEAYERETDGRGEVGVLGEPAGLVCEIGLINSYTDEITSVVVKKQWKDNEDAEGVRPQNVKVHLFVNGERSEFHELNEGNNWTAKFDRLPVHVFGKKVNYSVEEDVPEHYKMELIRDGEYAYTVVNTYKRDKFVFYKEWIGDNRGEISFTVYDAKGQPVKPLPSFTREKVDETTWKYEADITDCDDYTVVENPVDGYKTLYQNTGRWSDVHEKCHPNGRIINIQENLVPLTGDNQNLLLYAICGIVSLTAAVVLLITWRKRRR